MIFHPEYILNFGANKGYRLADVYHYLPSYIEFLIEYIPEFEIDVNEFEALPSPIEYYKAYTLKSSTGTPIEFSHKIEHNGAIKPFLSIDPKHFREISYKFSDKYKQILYLKSKREYHCKQYVPVEKSISFPIQEIYEWLKRRG